MRLKSAVALSVATAVFLSSCYKGTQATADSASSSSTASGKSFDKDAAQRGKQVFRNQGGCATCHQPSTLTDVLTLLHVEGRWQIMSKVFHYHLMDEPTAAVGSA